MEPDYFALRQQAEADVAKTCPPPIYAPGWAAFYAVAGTAVVATVFAAFTGLDLDNPKVMQAVYWTAALAGLAAYFPMRSQEKRYRTAVSRRFDELVKRARAEKH
jgi:uncharacterized membrane protein